MSDLHSEPVDVAARRRTRRATAAGGVGGCVILSFVAAYVTGNGWFFLAWWLPYVAAVFLGRLQGWLWQPSGRHAEPDR